VSARDADGVEAAETEGGRLPLASAAIARRAAPLRGQVVEELRRAIYEGRMGPGQRLVERDLIEALEVSRTTVREALRTLTAEGLVVEVPQKGSFVASPSREQIADLYAVRASLEHLGVERFVDRASDDDVAGLRAALDDYADAAGRADITDLVGAKDRFYGALTAGARSDVLSDLLASIQGRVRALRATSLSSPGRREASVDELRAVVGAVVERDGPRAAELCADHVEQAAVHVLGALED
jgi:DNA-binding GntR family transcriptional regulator